MDHPSHEPESNPPPERPVPVPLTSVPQMLAWTAVPVLASLVVIVGVLTSRIAVSLVGAGCLASYYAWSRWHFKKQNLTVRDLLIGWTSSPRPAPQDVVDRRRHP